MNRNHFQQLSKLRIKEAQALYKLNLYNGSYYLAGYSIECALKACIAKKTKRYDFPNKEIANKVWTHDLENLLKLAELNIDLETDMKNNKSLEVNWAIIKDWSESIRYDFNITDSQVKDFLAACSTKKNGILIWIRKRW